MIEAMWKRWWTVVLFASALPAQGTAAEPLVSVVDDFETVDGWSAHPADGVELAIGSDEGARGRALRLDFRFLGGGGYAVARKDFAVNLPENYAFSFQVRGEAPSNHLEFKLIDSTGENVWWSVRRDVEFPGEWQTFIIKKRHLSFAWGPLGGGEIRHVWAIEFAITAGSGGTGTVWIDELTLQPLPPPDATPPKPKVSASSANAYRWPQMAIDGNATTSWAPASEDTLPWLALDFIVAREYGGLVIDWGLPLAYPTDYVVEISDDGEAWRERRTVVGGTGGRDYLFLPETESRFLRVRTLRVGGIHGEGPHGSIHELAVKPLDWSATRAAFFEAIAADERRGSFPRGVSGEQSYWTVVGVDGDEREGLLGEDGMLETGKGGCSIEPFLFAGDRLTTWSDARTEQSLDQGFLPIPSVAWEVKGIKLTITAFGSGPPGESSIVARYRVRNQRSDSMQATLFLAIRPFQVNPPSQALNLAGGTALIREIAAEDRTVRVNGEPKVVCLTPPSEFGAATFDEGDIVVDYLRRGQLPPRAVAADDFAAASGALAFPLALAPGSEEEVDVLVPLHPGAAMPADAGVAWVEEEFDRVRREWEARSGRVTIELPESVSHVIESLRAQLAYILVNRAGPAIQPGARSYARSWIRDGALTSSALLRLGHHEAVRSFIEWYAPHQYASGKVPCVVDARGADPVPEHDSSGEFIFLIAEYYRYTGDRAFVERIWPRVLGAVAYLDSLRQERRTDEFRGPEKAAFFGILPPSISHEGYSARPMHSYWDDSFALRGFKDAAFLAGELGREEERARLSAIAGEFAGDFAASVAAAMRDHEIDYIPGCADLGDFDPTSTTITLSTGATSLPRAAYERTFEAYYEFFRERQAGEPWDAFTPYEIRNIGAFVRLGWRERAHELLDFFLSTQRPIGWRQWPEVVRSEARVPSFLGDLPHTWVGSDFIRSVLDLFQYEDEDREALVLGAGIPREWLAPPGVLVRDLPTPYGPLDYTMVGKGETVEVRIEGELGIPDGGILVRAPTTPAMRATVNGLPIAPGPDGEIVVREVPATVILHP
jgi:hypothetical protein